jgi:hypothetical protein
VEQEMKNDILTLDNLLHALLVVFKGLTQSSAG